jgi:hypothetical protein
MSWQSFASSMGVHGAQNLHVTDKAAAKGFDLYCFLRTSADTESSAGFLHDISNTDQSSPQFKSQLPLLQF